MAGGNFMHRVLSYVVNEVVVNGLANRLLSLAGKDCIVPEMARSIEAIENTRQTNFSNAAASPAFQRFAVRTSRKIEDISSIAAKKRQEIEEQVKEGLKNLDKRR